jgi:DNA-binding phage protein
MITRQQLSDLLSKVNVEDVAREAGVSTKTIYRLRWQKASPTLRTVESIVNALAKLKGRKASRAGR